MSEFEGVEIVTVRDEQGREHELLRVPEGYVLCLMTKAEAAKYAEWTEAKAVRLVVDDDETFAVLEVTDDLDWVTSPEADR